MFGQHFAKLLKIIIIKSWPNLFLGFGDLASISRPALPTFPVCRQAGSFSVECGSASVVHNRQVRWRECLKRNPPFPLRPPLLHPFHCALRACWARSESRFF